jgi:hypothetical protein
MESKAGLDMKKESLAVRRESNCGGHPVDNHYDSALLDLAVVSSDISCTFISRERTAPHTNPVC